MRTALAQPGCTRPTATAEVPVVGLSNGQVSDLLARAAAAGASAPTGVEVLRRRPEAAVFRVARADGGSAIVKVWARPGVRGAVRRVTRLDPAACEYRAMSRLYRLGANVPRPLGCGRLPAGSAPYTDGVLMEDLGPCEGATDYLKRLIAAGREGEAVAFEDGLIGTGRAILDAGLVDSDHGLVNTVVPSDGKPVRIDFELARWAPRPTMLPGHYGTMVGRLIGTYAFAVQPDVGRVPVFARRVVDRLAVPRPIVARAKAFVVYLMERQVKTRGIDTRVDLNW